MIYPEVVIFAGGAIGSVISACRNIRRAYGVDTYVVCLNSSSLQPVFNKSKYITNKQTDILKMKIKSK